MNISEIFGVDTITKTETDIIVDAFSHPTIVKYLKIIAKNDLLELATLSITERDDSEVAKKHALVQGKLSTIAGLLSISNQTITNKD